MTKIVFLDKLKKALGNDLPGAVVQEHVNYYHNYINEEIGKGRSEAEVIRELGDPWAIARNIIASEEVKGNAKETYDGYEPERQADHTWNRNTAIHVFGIDSWWKKLLLILGVIGVVLVIGVVIGGLLSLLMPLIPVLIVIWVVIRVLNRRR